MNNASVSYEIHLEIDNTPSRLAEEAIHDSIFVDAITGLLVDFKGIIQEAYWKAIDEDFGREAIGL